MSHVKAGGTSKNTRDSQGQRLGVKIFGGQKVSKGQVIVRQVGLSKRAGAGIILTYFAKEMAAAMPSRRMARAKAETPDL